MMTSELIDQQIAQGQKLACQIDALQELSAPKYDCGNGMAMFFPRSNTNRFDRQQIDLLKYSLQKWQNVSLDVLRKVLLNGTTYLQQFQETISSKNLGFNPKRQLKDELMRGLCTLESVKESVCMISEQELTVDNPKKRFQKPPKVFISHKKEDKAYADALVNLINFIIGADGDKIFCSSVQGYGIKQSCDIMDELKAQFDNFEVFMAIIHSPRYYQSTICLNEMGAAWVLGTRFSSFLTMDCKLEHMQGVINKEKIFIDPKDDSDQLDAHLNEFKDDLVELFGCNQPDENKWENARGRFIKEVMSLP